MTAVEQFIMIANSGVRYAVPNLDDLREAFSRDELSLVELEALTDDALEGRAVELPLMLADQEYARRQAFVRFSGS